MENVYLTTDEVIKMLAEAGIEKNEAGVRRLFRLKEINAERSENRKEGWRAKQKEVERYIQSQNPLYSEVLELRNMVESLKSEVERLTKTE